MYCGTKFDVPAYRRPLPRAYLGEEVLMRRPKLIEMQDPKARDVKHLRELELENDLLKLLYADLVVKTAAQKDGLVRSASAY
jgi:hypothetical protein